MQEAMLSLMNIKYPWTSDKMIKKFGLSLLFSFFFLFLSGVSRHKLKVLLTPSSMLGTVPATRLNAYCTMLIK